MMIRVKKETLFTGLAITVVLIAMLLLRNFLPVTTAKSSNLLTIFLTGLLTGGLTCLAVQGGLLAATLAQREETKLTEKSQQTHNALPLLAFLFAKLIAYTVLGFFLGWFGSLFQLSLTLQIIMQLAVIIFMLGTALNILQVHPIFRYFSIQPPKKITRLVRSQTKSKSLFAPLLLGAFTVFIPCGTTQAMMALAIASADPFMGSAILFAFILGTSPLFFILGYFVTKLGESLHTSFMKVAAASLIILAIFNLSNVLALLGHPVSFSSSRVTNTQTVQAVTQDNVVISILNNGYSPNTVNVKAGAKVTFNIKNEGSYSCASAFTIPAFHYQKLVEVGKTETLTLTMPDKPTQIPFMCSMGMYQGVINVL